ncbi:MAG: hypothetical protein EBR86_01645 [Planctomycetia bacterium]|nr:hypothetical protein [Planctomycetia bacterium]
MGGLLAGLLVATPVWAAPTIDRVFPGGGQQGSTVEIVLSGRSLAEVRELFFETGTIRVLEVANVDGNRVRARVEIPAACPPGNHRLRVRTAEGLSELRMFRVGVLEQMAEQEPNNDLATAGDVPLTGPGRTVAGVITAEDVDMFRVRARAGDRIAVAVDAVRLDQEMFDPHLEIVTAAGEVIAERDDHPLLAQDTMLAVTAPADGDYFLRVRESAYGGNDGCVYLLHVGGFPVPHVAWPPGGAPGSELDVTWLGDPSGPFTARVRVPTAASIDAGLADVLPVKDGVVGPVGVPLRVSSLPVVREAEPNDDPAQPTATSAPAALVGVLATPGDVDWVRVAAPRGTAWHVRSFGRRVGAPVDLVVAAHQDDTRRARITSNDDGDSPDATLKVTTPDNGSFLLRVSDHQRRGGDDFVWWLEVEPVLPEVQVSIPPGRNNTQDRLVGVVPRGNRTALLLNAARSEFSGDVDVACLDLPPGVQATVAPVATGASATLLVLEAPTGAAESTGLARLACQAHEATTGAATNVAAGQPLGGLRQTTALVFGLPNNSVYRTSVSDRLPVAVVQPAPLHVDVEDPVVPLVRGGSLDLAVQVRRGDGATGKVRLGFLFKPPGITAQTDVDVADGATQASFTLNAKADAAPREWPVVVTGLLRGREEGTVVCSRPVRIRVVEPMVEMTVARITAEVGTDTRLVGTLTKPAAFAGTARVKVLGLPAGVEAADAELAAGATELVVPIKVGPKAPPGKHDNIFFQVEVPLGNHFVVHRMPATQLRIDRPLQTAALGGSNP